MTGTVISLEAVRARRLPVPVPPQPPQQLIAVAADISILDYIRLAAETALQHVQHTRQPLQASDRAIAMRVKALLTGQPEGP